jgi:hypothetical protein
MSLKHQFDSEAMHDVVLLKAMSLISNANYIAINVDEVTTVDAQ